MAFVVPALAVVGTTLGASAGTAAAVGGVAVSTAVSLVGTGVSAYASHAQAKTQSAFMERNAAVSDENARRARQRSAVEQQDQDLVAKALLGELASSQASRGLDFGSGSFANQRKSAQVLARKDALNIRQGGELEAYNFLQEGADSRFEAGQARAEGRNALLSGFLEAGSTLVSGASSINRINANKYRTKARGLLAG